MIAALTGELRHVEEDRVHLQAGPVVYELLIPAADVETLRGGVGMSMTFHTILYFEGDSSGGNMEPRLVGFLRSQDKRFFQKFITVKGIGPKKALRALAHPAGDVARAIEGRDTRFLVELPQIGKRLAEQIVAELAGKVAEFASPATGAIARPVPSHLGHTAIDEEAIGALISLGERRADAEYLLDRVKQTGFVSGNSNDLVREMLRLRTARG